MRGGSQLITTLHDEFRHSPASAPSRPKRRDSASAVLCPPSSPSLSHPKFVLRGIFFELNGRWDSGGFPLREETGGILVPIQNAWWSRTLYYLFSVRDYGVHPRHSPRTFPLGLLAPRCLGFLLILAIPALRSGGEGRRLFGGRKESFPQLRLVSAGLDQPAQPTPFLVFISALCGVASASDFCIAR